MARASEQFRQSDVARWGIVALVLGAVAVLGANVSALIPQSALAGLHKSRLEGPTLEQLRLQVADLREQTIALKREHGVLAARFALDEQQGSDMLRRVAALEVSMPRLIEAIPAGASVDLDSITATASPSSAQEFAAEGGSVVVRQSPLPGMPAEAAGVTSQPLPEVPSALTAAATEPRTFGVAIGPQVSTAAAAATWEDISLKVGALMVGMSPRLADQAGSENKRIIVGPISRLSDATALCQRLERVAISCMPMPYTGTPMTSD